MGKTDKRVRREAGNFFSEATEWDLYRQGWWLLSQNAWPSSQCETFPKYAAL